MTGSPESGGDAGRRLLRYPANRFRIRRFGGARNSGAALYARHGVLTGLASAASMRPDNPQVAFLIGGLYEGPGVKHVEIAGYVDLERVEDPDTLVVNWSRDWRLITNRIERSFPGRTIMGWTLMRGDCGVQMGAQAARIHRTFFGLGHQVCLLIDGVRRQFAFHGTDSTGALVGLGFNLVLPRPAPSQGVAATAA